MCELMMAWQPTADFTKLFPHVKYVIDKYKHKLPKDDLKRLGKDINKKLVSSDYKKNRVHDPTAPLDQKQARKVKTFVKDFFDRAVVKMKNHEKERAARQSKTKEPNAAGADAGGDINVSDVADEVTLSDDEEAASTGESERKRKREVETGDSPHMTPSDGPSSKRLREDDLDGAPPPPPPPPPSEPAPTDSPESLSEEQQALREQEEALVRENEEAEREEATKAQGPFDGPRVNGGIIVSGEGEPAGIIRQQEVLGH